MTHDGYEGKCSHGALDLQKGSPAHKAMTGVVKEKRFLRQFEYFRLFEHTGALESFHNHILMYAPKRHSYTKVGYITRNLLAIIDHNEHMGQPVLKTSKGEDRYGYIFNHRSKCWAPRKMRQPKEYKYIPELHVQAMMHRYRDPKSLNQKIAPDPNDPRDIFPNRYMVPKPPMVQMIAEYKKKTRFEQHTCS